MTEHEGTQPRVYQEIRDYYREHALELRNDYAAGRCSFLPWCLPQDVVELSAGEVLHILRSRFGAELERAIREDIASPSLAKPNASWITTANVVGINVRTLGSFWQIVPYLLTVPQSFDAVHLLPIWEPGVVGSLYGISSWNINAEFFSPQLAEELPELDTADRQLRFVTNLIHLMGRTVGLDVIPHTDRFSQIVLAQPWCFEWLQREDTTLVDHGDHLIGRVEELILEWLRASGAAVESTQPEEVFRKPDTFFRELDEEERTALLFGPRSEKAQRDARRGELVGYLYRYGLEPVPATMAPPFRGLEIDPASRYLDGEGRIWRDYRFSAPQGMSRVFGPLTRYRLYHGVERGSWELDFSRPVREVWEYVAERYAEICRRYGFAFMRGDMSHVQMRRGGVPSHPGEYYDILGFVKRRVAERCRMPGFAYFAESFLAARDVFGYGEELDHLEAAEADAALGDLQSLVCGTPEFMRRLRRYLDLAGTRGCVPSFTVITGDKDDPRFDEFYRAGNAARYFTALFLSDLPSYTALGFETRDIRLQPAENDYYTKLYVFQEQGDSNIHPSKAVHGAYRWNTNGAQFATFTRIRLVAEKILPELRGLATRILIAPDAEHAELPFAWTHLTDRPRYLFVVNFSTERDSGPFGIPHLSSTRRATTGATPGATTGPASGPDVPVLAATTLEPVFSTAVALGHRELAPGNRRHVRVENLKPGEARIYRYRYVE